MRLSLRHLKMLFTALSGLLLGLINYYLFQPHILIFSNTPFLSHRVLFFSDRLLGHFLTGYFSDIAWCCSLCLITVIFSERKSLQTSEKIIILLLPFIIESAQYFHIIRGTFDWFDIIIYGVIIIAFSRFFPALNR